MTRRVVTLPTGLSSEARVGFATEARRQGADLLELRTDLHGETDLEGLREILPLLVSERGRALPATWAERAAEIDRPAGEGVSTISSLHAERPVSTSEALAHWKRVALPAGASLKHVEPLGPLETASRLFATQAALQERFGPSRVTVLATGPLALPFRCVLATRNALDYLALDGTFAAAIGQRLLADAVRETSEPGRPRRGILGRAIGHSRSPRIHRSPFDRLELPVDAPLAELLRALHPHYAGFAVTSPFKREAARLADSDLPAVNTLIRTDTGWRLANTDVEGAKAILATFGRSGFTVLGDGGATDSLRLAALELGLSLSVVRHTEVRGDRWELSGDVVWTWPASVAPPAALRFREARVAIVAYGSPARHIAEQIRNRGGEPLRLGPRWFVAQARAQRRLWDA